MLMTILILCMFKKAERIAFRFFSIHILVYVNCK